MRWKQTTQFALGGLLAVLLATPNGSMRAQQDERGQRVRSRTASGQTRDLYTASYALVIGVSDYAQWDDLPGVKSDVPEVRAVLERHGFRVTTVMNATRAQFTEALGNFLAEYGQTTGNRLLVYFAGHGHTLKTGYGQDNRLGYLVPADAPLPDEKNSGPFKRLAISMSEINTWAEQIESKHALFVLDSCFSGALFQTREGPVPDSISALTEEPVRQFITAGTEKQTVPDRSIFRRTFVEGLAGAADRDRDGFITGSELGDFIRNRVTDYSRKKQTPRFGKINNPDLDKGDLVFATAKPEPSRPPDPAPAPDRCAIAWDSIKTTDSEPTLEGFLAGCKDSPHAFAASLRLNDLRARRRPDPSSNPAANPAPSVLTPVIALPRGVSASALRAAPVTTASVDAGGRVTRRQTGSVQFYQEDLGDGVTLEMVAVPGGRFQMGSPASEVGRGINETQHWVRVSDFWIGRYEVTQRQWKAVMGALPRLQPRSNEFIGDDLPVVVVSWDEAQAFIQKLNAWLNGANYRLPREAEWEFAARAGKSTPFSFGATITPELENYGWDKPYGNAPKKKSLGHPMKVGSYVANPFGLFDMHGNAWEWCEDWSGPYSSDEVTDPVGPSTGSFRMLRGGGGRHFAVDCRAAARFSLPPDGLNLNLGFRLVLAMHSTAPISIVTAPAPVARMSVAGVPLAVLAPFTTVTLDANGRITDRQTNQESWGYVEDLGNGVKLEMVEVPPGDFLMGEDAVGAADYEKECVRYWSNNVCPRFAESQTPQRRVRVNGFLMGKYEVTQRQWKAVMGNLPSGMSSYGSKFDGDELPVTGVSWEQAQEFTRILNEKLKLGRSAYRLPSEAEWEYAARAGTRTPYAFGETISPETANYMRDKPHRNAPYKTFPGYPVKAGSYPANAFGLYDMHGNAWEWCEDDWHDNYNGAPTNGRAWVETPSRGSDRVARGGGWNGYAVYCRSANRSNSAPGYRDYGHGFRILRTYR